MLGPHGAAGCEDADDVVFGEKRKNGPGLLAVAGPTASTSPANRWRAREMKCHAAEPRPEIQGGGRIPRNEPAALLIRFAGVAVAARALFTFWPRLVKRPSKFHKKTNFRMEY